jgi:hypothetical protein
LVGISSSDPNNILFSEENLDSHSQPMDAAIEFWIGRNEQGFWIARDVDGREGGLFVSREEALKYVRQIRQRGQGVARAADAPLRLWQ